MSTPDWDDEAVLNAWLGRQRQNLTEYLDAQRIPVDPNAIEERWSLAPVASLWRAPTLGGDPRSIWAIAGDLPTDYIPGAWADSEREALRVIAGRWLRNSELMAHGVHELGTRIGDPASWPTLAPLLRSRAEFFLELVEDDASWPPL